MTPDEMRAQRPERKQSRRSKLHQVFTVLSSGGTSLLKEAPPRPVGPAYDPIVTDSWGRQVRHASGADSTRADDWEEPHACITLEVLTVWADELAEGTWDAVDRVERQIRQAIETEMQDNPPAPPPPPPGRDPDTEWDRPHLRIASGQRRAILGKRASKKNRT